MAVVGMMFAQADIESGTARASGIVAACNRYTHIRGCDNYGDNINTHPKSGNSRLGNITCITGAGSCIYDSRNFGDLISTTAGAVGGVLCLVNADDNVFERVESYGTVGKYNGGNYAVVETNADNYFDYIGQVGAAAVNVTKENIKYGKL